MAEEKEEIVAVIDGIPVVGEADEAGGNETTVEDLRAGGHFDDEEDHEPEIPEESDEQEIEANKDQFNEDVVEAMESEAAEKDLPAMKLGAYSQPVAASELKVGDVGGQVRFVRNKLARAGAFRLPDLVETSDNFDVKTEAAVRQFQKDEDLPVTGMVDIETMKALARVE